MFIFRITFGSFTTNSIIYISRKHLVEARRHGHIPSWRTSSLSSDLQQSKQQCSNPHCSNTDCDKSIKPMFTTSNKLNELFGIETTSKLFVFFCRKCYNQTYATICGCQGKT